MSSNNQIEEIYKLLQKSDVLKPVLEEITKEVSREQVVPRRKKNK